MEDLTKLDLKKLEKNHYDFAIVGSNLHAVILAYSLSRTYHKKVAILEPSENLGENDGAIGLGARTLPSHFNKVQNTPTNIESLNWLQELLRTKIYSAPIEAPPLTVESGKLIPFVGFGEYNFPSMDILNRFTSSDLVELEASPSLWLEQLLSLFIGDIYTVAEITRIESENSNLKSIVVNGSTELTTDNLIYCLPPKTLKNIVENEVIADKTFQKVLKAKSFSCVRLHLEHTPPTEAQIDVQTEPFHILYGNKDDFDPVVGQFFSGNEKLSSLWSCWMLSELIDDHEHLGSMLKHIKKQIKRVYPDLLNQLELEKIVVEMDSEGASHLAELQAKNFSKIKGLWLCHPQLLPTTGLIAKIDCARLSLSAIRDALRLAPGESLLADTEIPLDANP